MDDEYNWLPAGRGWPGKDGNTDDSATFSGTSDNDNATMTDATTLASLTISGCTGTVELDANLTLKGGDMNSGVIYQKPGTIEIASGTFTWH